MIYDCFIYFDEYDCLEIRTKELEGVADKHVIVQADYTFSGEYRDPRPVSFVEWDDRIINVRVEEPLPLNPWKAEAYVRNQIMRGLTRAEPDDLVIISDADEIPKASAVQDWKKLHVDTEVAALTNTSYYYTLDWKVSWDHHYFPVITEYENLDPETHGITPQKARYHPDRHILDAGWQFSCLGPPEKLLHKLRSFAHHREFEEITLNYIKACMEYGLDVAGRQPLVPVDIDESYPKCIQDEPDLWKRLLRSRA